MLQSFTFALRYKMLFDPKQIRLMREALLTAEQALHFANPEGLDEEIRRGLARAILIAVAGNHTNPLVIASIALRAYSTRTAA